MSTTPHQNIIFSKIDKIRSYFIKEVKKNSQVVICNMKYEDVEMLDSFCVVEHSDYGKLDDILIEFRCPFSTEHGYSRDLVHELLDSFNTTRNFAGDGDWVLKNWDARCLIDKEKDKSSPAFFFKVLQSLINAAGDFEDKIFAYLDPKRIENKKEFANWIREALNAGIPDRCGILVREIDTDAFLSSAISSWPGATVIKPNLNMDQAIKKMATAGNPAKPDVQFRTYLFNMQEGVAKKSSEHITTWRNKAKEVATKMEWKDMLITTDMLAGTLMLHMKEPTKAINFYDGAIDNGNELIKTNPHTGNPLTIQAMAAKGAALVSIKNYLDAIEVYKRLGEFGTQAADYMNAMEAWRMAGYCYRQIKQKTKALECNNHALQVAEKMDPEIRPYTTLPYVGKELFELTPRDENGLKALEKIDLKMKTYIGNDWKTRY